MFASKASQITTEYARDVLLVLSGVQLQADVCLFVAKTVLSQLLRMLVFAILALVYSITFVLSVLLVTSSEMVSV